MQASFDGSACKEILEQTIFSDTLIFTPETPTQQNNLLTRMTNLLATFSENNGNDLAIAGNLLLMLSSVQKKPSESRTDIATLYFQKASEYIKNNYAYPIQISDVARYVGIDRSYLYRIFMEHENISPKQYLLKHRLQMATQLLCSSTCTITEAALSCGFRDAPSFCNYFRQAPATPRKNSEKPTAESLTHNQTILHHFSTAHQKNPPQKIRIQTSGTSLPGTKKDGRSTCIRTQCK